MPADALAGLSPMSLNCARCFNGLAADRRWQAFTAEERRKVADFVRRWKIKPGDRVLEPGCGSGRLTVLLARLTGSAGRVVAFDAASDFVQLARRRHLPSQVDVQMAAAETLRLPRGAFDHIICFNVFPHLVPLATITRRLVRALRPGGRFCIAHTCSRQFVNAVHRRGPSLLHRHLLPPPRILTRLLRKAGLDEIEIDDAADRFFLLAVRPEADSPRPTAIRHV